MTRLFNRALIFLTLYFLTSCSKQQFIQQSTGMEPTIPAGSVLTVDKTAYNGAKPERWDIIVFKPDSNEDSRWCMRVVGLPGDVVGFSGNTFTLNGKPLAVQARFIPPSYRPPEGKSKVTFPYTVPGKHYFVMGDNVSVALDSRYWGAVARKSIIGRVEPK